MDVNLNENECENKSSETKWIQWENEKQLKTDMNQNATGFVGISDSCDIYEHFLCTFLIFRLYRIVNCELRIVKLRMKRAK